jgi:FtsZ-binding cell division protein ZapB
LAANDLRIKTLEEKRAKLLHENQEKQKDLDLLKHEIKHLKEDENPIIKQLREHFKALRE